MKRFGLLLCLMALLLAGCSVQETVNADVFLLRLTKDRAVTAETPFYEENVCTCFLQADGLRTALSMVETAEGELGKLCISVAGDAEPAAFRSLCARLLRLYAPREDADALLDALLAPDVSVFRYAQGKTHALAAAVSPQGNFFSITNTVLLPTDPPALTLRQEP